MGNVRLLLAISVVVFHTGISYLWTGTGGAASVQAFYMISGFYIAMILRGNYRDATLRFWANRALRLFPAYLVVAFATLAMRLAFSPDLVEMFKDLPSSAKAVVVLTNSFVFGQDWVLFLGVQNHRLQFVTDYHNSNPQLWKLMLDPPAWSLGVELSFYVLAPFLLRLRLSGMVVIALCSVLLRVVLVVCGLSFDPWSYRFFPNELALFLTGAIVQVTSSQFKNAWPRFFRLGPAAAAFMMVFIVIFPILPGSEAIKSIVLFLSLAICLPVIFENSKSSKTDRYIGDLSYLLYISHWTVILVIHRIFGVSHSFIATVCTLCAALLTAVALGITIDLPFRHLRARVRESARRESAVTSPQT